MSLFELVCRRRELRVKRRYAEQAYIYHSEKAQAFMSLMAKTDDDLMIVEWDLQKHNAEQSMAASDAAWSEKKGTAL